MQEGKVRDAGEPFSAPDADVILRSSDNVDFRSHRLVLRLSSPVFETMFALPTPPVGSATGDEQKDGRPVVCMAENEKALRILLSFCHTNVEPSLDTLDDLAVAVRLVAKFELPGAKLIVRLLLRDYALKAPERVYALAWIMQSRELVIQAAKASLTSPLVFPKRASTNIPEFHDITGHAVQQLVAFQSRCVFTASEIGNDLKWLRAAQIPRRAREKGQDNGFCGTCGDTKVHLREPADRPTRVKNWWLLHMKMLGEALKEGVDPAVGEHIPFVTLTVIKGQDCGNKMNGGCSAEEIVSALITTASIVRVRVNEIIEEALEKLKTPFQ